MPHGSLTLLEVLCTHKGFVDRQAVPSRTMAHVPAIKQNHTFTHHRRARLYAILKTLQRKGILQPPVVRGLSTSCIRK